MFWLWSKYIVQYFNFEFFKEFIDWPIYYNFFSLFQNCTNVLQSLRKGAFGSCESQVEDYVNKCNKRFPYAAAFKPPVQETKEATPDSNHVSQDENCHSNWCLFKEVFNHQGAVQRYTNDRIVASCYLLRV